jgi:Fuc2NAc and GlcNAc transferase
MNESWTAVFVAAAMAFAMAVVLTPAFRALARKVGLLDRPNQRSSHRTVVPRGGGAAIVCAVLAALAFMPSSPGGRAAVVPLVAGGLALAIVGLCDDRFGLAAGVRFGVQLAVAIGVVFALGGVERLPLPASLNRAAGVWGAPLSVVWIVAVVNFFNFIDGIDGLAAAQTVITATGILLAAWDPAAALVAAALAGAAAGFLPFNWSPASVFLGDVGSYFMGYTLAALPLMAPPASRSAAVLFVALSLWLFLADAAWTLFRRARRGERFFEAHRQHLYQELALRWGHARVTMAIVTGSTLLTAAALAGWWSGSAAWSWAAVGLAMVLFGGEWVAARRGRTA